jgi:hypothetical protein
MVVEEEGREVAGTGDEDDVFPLPLAMRFADLP